MTTRTKITRILTVGGAEAPPVANDDVDGLGSRPVVTSVDEDFPIQVERVRRIWGSVIEHEGVRAPAARALEDVLSRASDAQASGALPRILSAYSELAAVTRTGFIPSLGVPLVNALLERAVALMHENDYPAEAVEHVNGALEIIDPNQVFGESVEDAERSGLHRKSLCAPVGPTANQVAEPAGSPGSEET